MRNIIVLSLAGVALAAIATPALAQDITIAVAGPITGPVASIGDQMKRGAEAAAQAINEAGGVYGAQDQDRRRRRRLRSEAGGGGRQPHRRPADQVRRRPRLLGLVDPRSRYLRREQRPDDEPCLVEPGADREGTPDHHAPLRPRRRARRFHRPVDRGEIQGQEDRHPARQVGLRQRPRHGGEGQAQRRRRARGPVRGHQPGREGLQRDRQQAEERRRRFRLFRRLSPRGWPHPAAGGGPGLQAPDDDRRQPRDL